jgi:uncharacterized membrane protein YfcA
MDLTTLQYVYVGAAAFIVGFTKTSVGGVGILAVLLVALAIPGKGSPGVLLPMMIAADIMAVIYYRRSCQWGLLLKLLPLTLVGIAVGFGILWILPDLNFEKIIGGTILAMFALDLALTETAKQHFRGNAISSIAGVIAGMASMIANAAGPVFGVYLLQLGLKKEEFVGTRSWFFLILNIAKVPFSVSLGLINSETLTVNFIFLPVILVGAYSGYKVLGFINIRLFGVLIRLAVLVAGLKLIAF